MANEAKCTLFCLDAGTGALVWKKELPQYAALRAHRDTCVTNKTVSARTGGFPWCAPVIVHGMTVVDLHGVPDKKELGKNVPGVPGGTFAYDLATREERWHVGASARTKSPLIWRRQGQEYVIVDKSLIDPPKGKPL